MEMMFEMRNICLYEPNTEEMVQLVYLTNIDDKILEGDLLQYFGNMEMVGFAKNNDFLTLGVFPISLHYEKNGKTLRERENVYGFQKKGGNIYQVTGGNIGYIWRKCQKQKVA